MTDAQGRTDVKKTLPGFRARTAEVTLVDIPETRYLAVDGAGDPNTSPAYAEALGALYPLAYELRSASRAELGRDYVVPPLEGLWWADDMGAFTWRRDRSQWRWTMLIMVPDGVPDELVGAARDRVRAKRAPARLDEARLMSLHEGLCAQTLHIGPYDAEGPVIARMHRHAAERGHRLTGRHHEIYLSDARRARPERLRTILRQPVTPR